MRCRRLVSQAKTEDGEAQPDPDDCTEESEFVHAPKLPPRHGKSSSAFWTEPRIIDENNVAFRTALHSYSLSC